MKLHVMTWNCGFYRECHQSPDLRRYNSIMNIIKGRLELENSMVVLQEIPYKVKREDGLWVEHSLYKKLMEDFPDDKYEVIFLISNNYQIMMTVIIFKKSTFMRCEFEKNGMEMCNNRIVGCKINDISIVGVHMPTDFEIGRRDNKKTQELKRWKATVWDNLLEFVKQEKSQSRKLIILGDFNAYIGCEYKLTESKFIELHRYSSDIIPDDVPTYKGGDGTPIDHIFVNFNTKSAYVQKIEEKFEWSDHKYIMAEFNI